MSVWSERDKFFYETIRIFVVATLGFLATVWIVQPWESTTKYSSFLEKEKALIKKEVVDDFLRTSYMYSSSLYKVMSDDTGLDKKAEIELYESTYRNYRVDLNRIILYFDIENNPKHLSLIEKSNNLRYELRKMYLNIIKRKNWIEKRTEFKAVNNKIAKLALRSIGL